MQHVMVLVPFVDWDGNPHVLLHLFRLLPPHTFKNMAN